MNVLGFYGSPTAVSEESLERGYPYDFMHDASAALLRDGVVVAAIAQERLDRVKQSNAFPADAIRFCLREANITIAEVDRLVFPFLETTMDGYSAVRPTPSTKLLKVR
jgi:predicted NodU family carbamoyl transferase